MSKSLNRIELIGNLGRDPETRHTKDGTAVCNFSIATTETYKGNDKTQWHNVVAWGKLAEICDKYLSKGSRVYVCGPMEYDEWKDKDGNKRLKAQVVARELIMLSGKSESHRQDDDADDIPF